MKSDALIEKHIVLIKELHIFWKQCFCRHKCSVEGLTDPISVWRQSPPISHWQQPFQYHTMFSENQGFDRFEKRPILREVTDNKIQAIEQYRWNYIYRSEWSVKISKFSLCYSNKKC